MKFPLLNFNGGEVSPLLHHRNDLQKFNSFCRQLDNYIVTPQGGIKKRIGTRTRSRIGDVGSFDGARVIPWSIDRTDFFQMIFIDQEIQFFNPQGIRVYTLTGIPYANTELAEVYFKQVVDTMYLAHPDYPLQKISRPSQFVWTIGEHVFNGGAYGFLNTDTTKVMNLSLINPSPNGAPFVEPTDYAHHWPLDQTSLLTSLGTANTLTLSGGAALITSDDVRGEVLSIPTAESATLASTWTLGHTDTIAMWIKPVIDADADPITDVRARLLSGSGGAYLDYDTSQGTGQLNYFDGTFTKEMKNVYLEPNKWNLLIINQDDGDDARVYVNDQIVISNQQGVFNTDFVITDIGDTTAITDGMEVLYSNVKFYDDDLTEAERTQLYEANDISYGYKISSSTDQFASTDVGRLVRITSDKSQTLKGSYTADTISGTLPCSNSIVTLRTEGSTWTGNVKVEKSINGGTTWETIIELSSEDNFNGEKSADVIDVDAIVRVNYDDSSGTMKWSLTVDGDQHTHLLIEQYIDEREVNCSLQFGAAAAIQTWEWALGAFSDTTGYPTCIQIHDERMFLGGVRSYPASIWGSVVNAWENWQTGTLDTSGIFVTLSNDIRNRIRFFVSELQLIVGTDSGEWTLGARNADQALTPTNITAQRHSKYGADAVQPVEAGNNNYFIESGGKRIRDVNFVFEADGYVSNDMTILAPHLTKTDDFIRLAYSRSPDVIIWSLRADGTLLSFTLEQTQNVAAWAKHPMDGATVIDINSVLTDDGDEITLIVQRADGVYYEVIQQTNAVYIDSQTKFTGIVQSDCLALPGNETYRYLNENLEEFEFTDSDIPILTGQGSFIRIDTSYSALVLKYDGTTLINGDDYANLGNDLYWIPSAADKTLITAFDGLSAIPGGSLFTAEYDETFVVKITDSTITLADLTVTADVTTLTLNTDYWNMTGDKQILIIDPNSATAEQIVLTYTSGGAAVDTNVYETEVPRLLISTYNAETITNSAVYFGFEIADICLPVDLFGMQEGAGTKNRLTRLDMFFIDTVGFQVSADATPFKINAGNEDEITWEDVHFTPATVVAAEPLDLFSGKKSINMQHGYQDEAHIGLRSRKPYNCIISAIGIIFERIANR